MARSQDRISDTNPAFSPHTSEIYRMWLLTSLMAITFILGFSPMTSNDEMLACLREQMGAFHSHDPESMVGNGQFIVFFYYGPDGATLLYSCEDGQESYLTCFI